MVNDPHSKKKADHLVSLSYLFCFDQHSIILALDIRLHQLF